MEQTSRWIRIAHRGASAQAPENTLAAFSKALEIGVDAVELDVHGTSDGQVVVIHDNTLDRTTNMSGKVRNMTCQQIQQADAGAWFGSEFTDERVPILADALDLIKGRAIAVVEIKDAHITSAVIATIRHTHTMADVLLISFQPAALLEAFFLNPLIPTGILVSRDVKESDRNRAIDLVQTTSGAATNVLDIDHQMITEEFAYEVRRRGINLWAWTVDDVERMRELVSWGVQGITSNYPDRFDEVGRGT